MSIIAGLSSVLSARIFGASLWLSSRSVLSLFTHTESWGCTSHSVTHW